VLEREEVVRRSASGVFYAGLLVSGLLFLVAVVVGNRAAWGVDYNQFYSAAKLTGTGHL